MARVKRSGLARQRRKKVIKSASGYFGSKHILFRTAKEQVMHSLRYAYIDRRQIKSDFRKLWIRRINAACRMCDISYSQMIHGLKLANVSINRKMLAELAINDFATFEKLCTDAKKQIAK